MDTKYKKIARAGFIAKGTVYAIVGILTFMAAFNLGGQKTGKLQVLKFLDQQAFGNALLILIGLGLACYALWRFIQSISDPEGIGDDDKGTGKRIAFFISGLIYLGLGILAVMRVLNSGSGSTSATSGGNMTQSSFLASQTGLYFIGAIGIALIVTGIFQFITAYKEKYWSKFDSKSRMEEKRRKTIKNTANFGLCSRGVIFLIIGYFAIRAALTANPSKIKTTTEAFAFLREHSYGAWLMGIVAAGMVGYAVYMFMMARYRHFRDNQHEEHYSK